MSPRRKVGETISPCRRGLLPMVSWKQIQKKRELQSLCNLKNIFLGSHLSGGIRGRLKLGKVWDSEKYYISD
jgi:hypothetical protein